MEFTHESIEEFLSVGRIEYPVRVAKPILPAKPTPADYRLHASRLEQYDVDYAEYTNRKSEYYRVTNENIKKLKALMFEELGITDNIKAELLYGKAYDMNHSEGLSSVYHKMEELVDLIS